MPVKPARIPLPKFRARNETPATGGVWHRENSKVEGRGSQRELMVVLPTGTNEAAHLAGRCRRLWWLRWKQESLPYCRFNSGSQEQFLKEL